MRRALIVLLSILLLIHTSNAVVIRVDIKGEINKGTSELVSTAFKKAEELNASAVLITIDTPGGLLNPTKDIVSMIINSRIPVITYVYPRGAFSASAGSFILIAGHIAAMANGTSVGSATPVTYGIEPRVENKTINYMARYMRSLAELRNRSSIVEKFVTEGISLTAQEAYRKGVIDVLADDIDELFEKIDGWTVDVNGKSVKIRVKDEEIIVVKKSIKSIILEVLTNPQIALILFLIGLYALIFGITSPGIGAEVFGAICLILSLIGFGSLSIDYIGIILIALGILFLILELLTPTHGVLSAASVVCIVLGILIVFKEPLMPKGFYKGIRLFMIGISIGITSFMTFVIIKIAKTRKMKLKVGRMEGEVGEVIEFRDGRGFVKIRGEIWSCVSDDELKPGDTIKVVGREGLTLKVKKWRENWRKRL